MTVRAKFKCYSIGEFEESFWTVHMSPVISGSPENEKFWKYTPSGSIQLGTNNKSAIDYFEIGKEYYIDFTKA